ncbi:hypothetical protein M1116_02015 [Patescibacteria group bacterium]|nr:hypothetical protein [Patescibacteria group bacterium]
MESTFLAALAQLEQIILVVLDWLIRIFFAVVVRLYNLLMTLFGRG